MDDKLNVKCVEKQNKDTFIQGVRGHLNGLMNDKKIISFGRAVTSMFNSVYTHHYMLLLTSDKYDFSYRGRNTEEENPNFVLKGSSVFKKCWKTK